MVPGLPRKPLAPCGNHDRCSGNFSRFGGGINAGIYREGCNAEPKKYIPSATAGKNGHETGGMGSDGTPDYAEMSTFTHGRYEGTYLKHRNGNAENL